MGGIREESIVCHDYMTREIIGRNVGLTLQHTEWEINRRYVGVTGVVCEMGDMWELLVW